MNAPTKGRIDGLDVARALALLGMVAAHVGNDGTRIESGAWHWLWVAGGRPSALFAVLAGVSISLMLVRRAGGEWTAVTPIDVTHTRARVATRGLILIACGYLLDVLGTPVDIILANLGLMFLLSLVAFRWRTGWLLAGAGLCLVLGRYLADAAATAANDVGLLDVPVMEKMWSFRYPAIAWMAYIFAGMAIGRINLRSGRVQGSLVAGGAALAAAGYGIGAALEAPEGEEASPWTDLEPHSYTPFEMAGNLGVAAAVIGICIAIAARFPRAVWPLAATGSMAFTLYVAHVIVIAIVGDEMVWIPSNTAFVWLCAGLIAFACLWRWRIGQGPLERLMTVASNRMGDTAVTVREGMQHERH